MAIWYDQVGTQNERFASLPQVAMESFAIACVDHAFSTFYPEFKVSIEADKVDIARHALDLLWKTRAATVGENTLKDALERVESIVPDTESPDDGIEGWAHVVTGIYSAIRCVLGEKSLFWAKECAESSFLAVRERETNRFMQAHSTHLSQHDEPKLEQEALALLHEVEFQLRCLELCEQGISIDRQVLVS